jgi:hypothetical protein
MEKKAKEFDVGALLVGEDMDTGETEEPGEDATAEVDPMEMKREAMSALAAAMKGDDLDAQVSAFETMMEACGLSAPAYSEEE